MYTFYTKRLIRPDTIEAEIKCAFIKRKVMAIVEEVAFLVVFLLYKLVNLRLLRHWIDQ